MQRRGTRRPAQDDEGGTETPPAERDQSAEDVSVATDDVLDDIDRALKAALGYDEDEIVDVRDLEVRAKEMVDKFEQKGGQ